MKRKYTIDDYNFDLGNLYNNKATLEYHIDRDQKFISQNHSDLGTNQFLYYKESIESNQKQLKEILIRIENLKRQINAKFH